jgi:hypothetical protein
MTVLECFSLVQIAVSSTFIRLSLAKPIFLSVVAASEGLDAMTTYL